MRRLLLPVLLSLSAAPLTAQDALTFPLAPVLALAGTAYHAHAPFTRALSDVLPITIERDGPVPSDLSDPFTWAISGTFGGDGSRPIRSAIFTCTRYGLATRDAFEARGLLDPEMFALMGALRPAFDDAERWPDGAVARLACDFVWDDARVVAILPRAAAAEALAAVYDSLRDVTGAPTVFGEDGFSLSAEAGPQDSVVVVDSAHVVRTLGHQQVRFRSFLMGGGF